MTAYVIAEMEVSDPEAYRKYMALTPAAIARHGGRFLVRGGPGEALEGAPPNRIVVLAFDSMEAARRFYDSAEYRAARKEREGAATARLFIVEGAAAS
jgi:uncharacterized protein (DUF1330 family)